MAFYFSASNHDLRQTETQERLDRGLQRSGYRSDAVGKIPIHDRDEAGSKAGLFLAINSPSSL